MLTAFNFPKVKQMLADTQSGQENIIKMNIAIVGKIMTVKLIVVDFVFVVVV